MFSSVFEGRDAELFFEEILEVRLAGKEQEITDRGKGAVGIRQKQLCLLQFGFHDISAYRFACFFLELFHKGRTTLSHMLNDVGNADGLICMRLNKLQGFIHLVGIRGGVFLFGDAVRKVHDGGIAELIDLAHRSAALAFLRIEVDELIGLLDV